MTGALDSDNLTVAQALEYWLENRRADVKRSTWKSYYCAAAYVVGPLLEGKRGQRYNFTRSGRKPPDAKFVQMLGPTLVGELTVRRQVFCDTVSLTTGAIDVITSLKPVMRSSAAFACAIGKPTHS